MHLLRLWFGMFMGEVEVEVGLLLVDVVAGRNGVVWNVESILLPSCQCQDGVGPIGQVAEVAILLLDHKELDRLFDDLLELGGVCGFLEGLGYECENIFGQFGLHV